MKFYQIDRFKLPMVNPGFISNNNMPYKLVLVRSENSWDDVSLHPLSW